MEFAVEQIIVFCNFQTFVLHARMVVLSGNSSYPIRANADECKQIRRMINNQSSIQQHFSIQINKYLNILSLKMSYIIYFLFKNVQNHKIQMSILSKQQFDKVCMALQSIDQQLLQQSKNIQNKIILAHAKIDCISQVVERQNQKNLHEGADKLLKIHQQIASAQTNTNKLSHKYKQQVGSMKQQLRKQIEELEQNVNMSKEARTKEVRQIEAKLLLQVQRIQEKSKQQNQREIEEILCLKAQLIKQLGMCEQELLENRKKMAEDENKLCQKIQKIFEDLEVKVKELGSLRREKKGNFLQLLQKVIIKIRESQTLQI